MVAYSQSNLNPAVTIALAATLKIDLIQASVLIIAQILGSLTGVGFLALTIPNAYDSGFGANSLSAGVTGGNAVMGEIFLTCLLVFAVLQADIMQMGEISAPIVIGMTVFVAHGVLLAVDGCSINPVRSFAPAVASGMWTDFWVFVVGPFVGAICAVVIHFVFMILQLKAQGGNNANNENGESKNEKDLVVQVTQE